MPVHTLGDLKKGGGAPRPQNANESKNIKWVTGDNSDFAAEIRKTTKLVVAYFTASWCGPCKAISPRFSELADQHTDVVFLKIDVDEASEIARDRGIKAMPTFQFYRRGDKLGEFSGANPTQLVAEIEKYKSQSTTPGGSTLNSGGGYVLGGSATNRDEKPEGQSVAAETTATNNTFTEPPPQLINGLNPILIATLVEMGFTQGHAMKGLKATGSDNVEAAADWCMTHEDKGSDAAASDASDDMVVEGQEKKQPLTEEQKAEQKLKLEQRLVKLREDKAKEEAEAARLREISRRAGGKDAADAKRKYEDKQMELKLARERKEKEEDARAKAAIKAKIDQDKRERAAEAAARQAKAAGNAAPSAVPAPAATAPAPAEKKEYTQSLIQLRFPNGTMQKAKFTPTDTLAVVLEHAGMLLGDHNISLVSNFPKKVYSKTEGNAQNVTLQQADLVPTGTLIVSKR